MKNIIYLEDIDYGYMYDEITCFEHPLIIALNHYNDEYGRLVTTLMKFRSTYVDDAFRNNFYRDIIIEEISKIFGVNIEENAKINQKKIIKSINNNRLIIAGINLKELYYSDYYKRDNWGHWLLINGYDEFTDNISIFDNVQFSSIEESYDQFVIPYILLKKANKSYINEFGYNQSFQEITVNKIRKEKDVLLEIIKKYLSIKMDDSKSYRQEIINLELNKLSNIADITFVQKEHQKKLININKYKRIFFLELEQYMEKYDYTNNCYEQFSIYKNFVHELLEICKKQVYIYVKNMISGQKLNDIINNEIINKEIEIQKIIKHFYNYLLDYNYKKIDLNNYETYFRKENDKNYIELIKENENTYSLKFDFYDGKICNWWEMDESPKVLFDINKYSCIVLKNVRFESNKVSYLPSQIGIYVKNKKTKEAVLVGIEINDNKEEIVYSIVGQSSIVLPIIWDDKSKIICTNNENEICIKVYNDGKEQIIYSELVDIDIIEVGITCKTWGNKGIRKIKSTINVGSYE